MSDCEYNACTCVGPDSEKYQTDLTWKQIETRIEYVSIRKKSHSVHKLKCKMIVSR